MLTNMAPIKMSKNLYGGKIIFIGSFFYVHLGMYLLILSLFSDRIHWIAGSIVILWILGTYCTPIYKNILIGKKGVDSYFYAHFIIVLLMSIVNILYFKFEFTSHFFVKSLLLGSTILSLLLGLKIWKKLINEK